MPGSPSHAAPDESTTGRHIPALDGLRGLAILLVLACHLLNANPDPQGNLVVRLLARVPENGWVGVDLFFVLSGFLITGILYDTLGDRHFFRNFYVRRSLRIFPVYYAFLLLLLVVTIFTHDRWYAGLWQILTYTINWSFTGVLVTYAKWINLNHLWSLAVEEQFYLVWPLLVFALKTRRRIAIAAACGITLSLCLRFYFVHFTVYTRTSYTPFGFTPARLDGLLCGALLALAIRSRFRTRALRVCVVALAAGLAGLGYLWATHGELDLRSTAATSVGLPLLLAVTFSGLLGCCLRAGEWIARAFEWSVLRFFGRYSYGLYLFHYTIGATEGNLRGWLFRHGCSKLLGVLLPAAIGLALSIAAAWLSFRYFELPFLRLKDRFTNHARHPRLADVLGSGPSVEAALADE